MYTQCTQCQTVFHITMEQLRAHDGVVRCGRCDHVFNADQQLFSNIPEETARAPRKKPRAEGAKPKSARPNTSASPKRAAKAPPKPPADDEELQAAPAPWVPPVEVDAISSRRAHAEALEPAPAPARRFSALWIVGSILLAAALALQTAYFYRDPLAAHAALRPSLDWMCEQLDCIARPPYDASRIELVEPTNFAPHPRVAGALRLRATLVNRGETSQAHPYMQVTLTDNAGQVLASRIFSPSQYLEQRTAPGTDMPPHFAVSALIDITNPDGKAVGYQIDFLAPPLS